MNYKAELRRNAVSVNNKNATDSLIKKPSLFEEVSLISIRSYLTWPTLGAFLFLIGFNGIFFTPLFFPQTLFSGATSGSFRYLFLSWLLITLGGLLESFSSNLWLVRRKPIWVAISFSAIIFLILRGLFDGEAIISIMQKSLPFIWLLLLPAVGLRRRNWSWMWAVFFIQAAVGIIYSVNTIFIEGANTRSEIFNFEGQNFLTLSMYMGMFMILFLPMMRGRLLKSIVFSVFTVGHLVGYFLASRLSLVLLPIEILLVIFIFSRAKKGGIVLIRLALGLTIISLLLLPFFIFTGETNLIPTFDQGYEGLIDRVYEQGTLIDTIRGNIRWYETRVVVSTMNFGDWIAGKGLAARWQDSGFAKGEIRDMVHNTWLNAIYWGGILLFLAVAAPLVWNIKILLKSRKVVTLGFAAYAILVYVKFPFFVTTLITPEWVLFCLALGVCMKNEARQL